MLIFRAAIVTALLAWVAANAPIITLSDGTQLQGVVEGSVAAFRGIRFAQPPIGNLRWAPPLPWINPNVSQVYDVTSFGSTCKQILWGDDGLFSKDHGNEDCLFLNVFVGLDALNANAGKAAHAVGIFVHGGSYINGAASEPLYDGVDAVDFWQGKVILVTTNYRLNVFGFLGADELRAQDPESGSTGNYGIQDQRMAFDWVRRNIVSFGGDKDQVTIFGESAGAGSMTNHITMKKSWGLFSSVVAESGAFYQACTQNMSNAQWTYQNLLTSLSCSDVACLLSKSADDVFNAGKSLPSFDSTTYGTYQPVVDGVELTTHPWILAANGQVVDVPLMMGSNSDEGAIFTYVPHTIGQQALNEHWRRSSGYSNDEIDQLNKIYIEDQSYPEGHASKYWYAAERSMGDRYFACPAKYGAQTMNNMQLSGARKSPVYMYHFEHHPRNANYTRHVSELEYVFHQKELLRHEKDNAMADYVSSYWANFFLTKNPNGKVMNQPRTTLPTWPTYSTAEDNLLAIVETDDIQVKTGVKFSECQFHMNREDTTLRATFPPQ